MASPSSRHVLKWRPSLVEEPPRHWQPRSSLKRDGVKRRVDLHQLVDEHQGKAIQLVQDFMECMHRQVDGSTVDSTELRQHLSTGTAFLRLQLQQFQLPPPRDAAPPQHRVWSHICQLLRPWAGHASVLADVEGRPTTQQVWWSRRFVYCRPHARRKER